MAPQGALGRLLTESIISTGKLGRCSNACMQSPVVNAVIRPEPRHDRLMRLVHADGRMVDSSLRLSGLLAVSADKAKLQKSCREAKWNAVRDRQHQFLIVRRFGGAVRTII